MKGGGSKCNKPLAGNLIVIDFENSGKKYIFVLPLGRRSIPPGKAITISLKVVS